MFNALQEKYLTLQNRLRGFERVAVAYSGGVDSTFLLHTALKACGPDNVIALMARGSFMTPREREAALSIARQMGVQPYLLDADEYSVPEFCDNIPQRCYHCKRNLFVKMKAAARELEFDIIVDGTNADDMDDYRPGQRALKELGVHSPLALSGLRKEDIRNLSRLAGLPTADQPSRACLASRIPYGTPITAELLNRVGRAEEYFTDLGFEVIRVRAHGQIALIEVPPEDFARLISARDEICSFVKAVGFPYVALDLQGFRSGSQNEVLDIETKSR